MERYKCPALLPPPVLLLQLGTESDSGSSRLRTASSLRRSGWPSFTAFAPWPIHISVRASLPGCTTGPGRGTMFSTPLTACQSGSNFKQLCPFKLVRKPGRHIATRSATTAAAVPLLSAQNQLKFRASSQPFQRRSRSRKWVATGAWRAREGSPAFFRGLKRKKRRTTLRTKRLFYGVEGPRSAS